MSLQEAKLLLQRQLVQLPVTDENGTGWYVWLFTQAPDVRKYFAGAHDINPQAVPSSERFQKQGKRFLIKINEFVDNLDHAENFKRISVELGDSHIKRFKIPFELYPALAGIFEGYVESKVGMNEEEKKSWDLLFGELAKYVQTCYAHA